MTNEILSRLWVSDEEIRDALRSGDGETLRRVHDLLGKRLAELEISIRALTEGLNLAEVWSRFEPDRALPMALGRTVAAVILVRARLDELDSAETEAMN